MIHFRLGESQHGFEAIHKRNEPGDVEPGRQFIHRHRQNAGNKNIGDGAGFAPFLQHFKKSFQETIIRCQLAVEVIFPRRDELIGKAVILVHDDVERRHAGFINLPEYFFKIGYGAFFKVYHHRFVESLGITSGQDRHFPIACSIKTCLDD